MEKTRQPSRGIYLLPTLFTVGNLFCGYSSIVHAFQGALEQAAVFIVVAAVLDGLDGRIARLTGTTSDFGFEFDSLADIVSFGVAPALLAHRWALEPFERVGGLIAFLFLICAAMRLARFNIQKQATAKRHFAGLPSPMAAAALAGVALAVPEPARKGWAAVGFAVLIAFLALMMISRLRYRSFKEFDLRSRRSYFYVLPLALMIVATAFYPKWAVMLFSLAYLVSAPADYAWSLLRRSRGGAAVRSRSQGGEAEVVDEPALR